MNIATLVMEIHRLIVCHAITIMMGDSLIAICTNVLLHADIFIMIILQIIQFFIFYMIIIKKCSPCNVNCVKCTETECLIGKFFFEEKIFLLEEIYDPLTADPNLSNC